jgi:hypothetical protein
MKRSYVTSTGNSSRPTLPHLIKYLFLVLVCTTGSVHLYSQHSHDGMAAKIDNPYFALLKGLVGSWTGHFQWSTNPSAKGDMDVNYSLTGNGSAVVEDLITNNTKSMTSVYHMDGLNLRMTHYCGAGNQPRLIADTANSTSNSLEFKFVDITNLASEDAGHVFGLKINFVSETKLTLTFRFTAKGKESDEFIELTRKNI